jgi:cytochrome P450
MRSRSQTPPGSRLPGVVQAVLYARDPVGFLERYQRRFGDVFSLPFPAFGTLVYVADPKLVKEVFTGDPQTLRAGAANARALEPVLGRFSLLTLDGDEHMGQRKLLLPPFHGEAVRRYRDLIAEIAAREVERWPARVPFELRPRMQAITLEVILRAVFGVRGEERLARFRALLPRLTDATGVQMWLPFLRRDLGPWSPWGRFLRMRAAVDELVYDEIRRRRAEPDTAERDDVLSLLLRATHEDGSPMSDRELRDELITLLTAGHETSATALAWAFERLLRNPGAMRELIAEVDAAEGDEYAEAVVKETLRVRPIITDVARLATSDIELGGWTISAGTIVVPAIALVQLMPDVYPDPYEFRPERFLDGQPAPYTWIPFGGGVRRCLGAAFAQLEIRTVLQTVVARTELQAPDPAPERTRLRNVTLVPRRGARVVMSRRREAEQPAGAAATYA